MPGSENLASNGISYNMELRKELTTAIRVEHYNSLLYSISNIYIHSLL